MAKSRSKRPKQKQRSSLLRSKPLLLIVAGAALISAPLALIVLGVCLAAIAVQEVYLLLAHQLQ